MDNAARNLWGYYDMPSLEGYRKYEKIDGIIYDMSTSANYKHGLVNVNICNRIYNQLKDSQCYVFMENLDLEIAEDGWVIPDVMIVCDRNKIENGTYKGVPGFVVETLSPSTAKKDRQIKLRKYESMGVDEFWLVEPNGRSLEIYYLENGAYHLEAAWLLEPDPKSDDYNADVSIALRRFPHITMTLGGIFDNVD